MFGAFQMWDLLFESYENYGRTLVEDNVIKLSDIETRNHIAKCKILSVGLPAYSILQSLLLLQSLIQLDFCYPMELR